MKTDHEIRRNVMRQVYVMYYLRQVTSPALRVGLLGGVIVVLTQMVSVKDIVINMLGTNGLSGFVTLLYSAITTTEYSVLALSALSLGLIIWFAVEQIQKALHIGFWDDSIVMGGQPQGSTVQH